MPRKSNPQSLRCAKHDEPVRMIGVRIVCPKCEGETTENPTKQKRAKER